MLPESAALPAYYIFFHHSTSREPKVYDRIYLSEELHTRSPQKICPVNRRKRDTVETPLHEHIDRTAITIYISSTATQKFTQKCQLLFPPMHARSTSLSNHPMRMLMRPHKL
jgi:hypothetical protein